VTRFGDAFQLCLAAETPPAGRCRVPDEANQARCGINPLPPVETDDMRRETPGNIIDDAAAGATWLSKAVVETLNELRTSSCTASRVARCSASACNRSPAGTEHEPASVCLSERRDRDSRPPVADRSAMIFPAINPYRESLTPTADGTIYADDAIYVRRSDRNCRFLALERTFVNLVLLRGSSDTLLHDASGNHKCLGPQRQRPAVLDLIRPAVDSLGRLVPAASAEDLVALHARPGATTRNPARRAAAARRLGRDTAR
jgi:hypothetical protein